MEILKLSEISKPIEYKDVLVVPSQAYAKFSGKEVRAVNQALVRLEKAGRLGEGSDFFRLTGQMITSCDHEEIQGLADPRYGVTLLTRKAVNTLSHYFDDPNSITLSKEVNAKATGVMELQEIAQGDPLMAQILNAAQMRMKQLELERRVEETEEKVFKIEDRVNNMNGDTRYRTILAYCNQRGLRRSLDMMVRAGKKAASLCKHLGYDIGKVPDERWGSVNSYPIDVLDELVDSGDL